jgi:hypothetical protein
MLQDKKIMMAVSRILQRSEKQPDLDKLITSFVDTGIIPQINNPNSQILYGRRGTGKTHILHVLKSHLASEGYVTVYIDARTLGSTAQFSDTSVSLRKRCLSLFRDILSPVYNALIEAIIENPPSNTNDANKALDAADQLINSITQPVTIYEEKTKVEETDEETQNTQKAKLKASLSTGLSCGFEENESNKTKAAKSTTYDVFTEDKVIFPQFQHFLQDTLKYSNLKLAILLDEWSSLPYDIQPYLAEFLKRSIIPAVNSVLKITALEHRSIFSKKINDSILGFELGADVSVSQDLDDNYVYDRNPSHITTLYADMLFKHISLDLESDYLNNNFKIYDGKSLASKMFTDPNTFNELSRAAEGVIRDLINIFTMAFFHAQRRARNNIDKKAVVESARQWFEQDKAQHLDEKMQTVLRKIVDHVIGVKKARSFLLPRNLEKHELIQKLFDARVIHHMQRGYADKDNPGLRYNIYTLDYGTYVDLIGTSKQPDLEFLVDQPDAPDVVVPFDDKRSIRRIILSEDILTV